MQRFVGADILAFYRPIGDNPGVYWWCADGRPEGAAFLVNRVGNLRERLASAHRSFHGIISLDGSMKQVTGPPGFLLPIQGATVVFGTSPKVGQPRSALISTGLGVWGALPSGGRDEAKRVMGDVVPKSSTGGKVWGRGGAETRTAARVCFGRGRGSVSRRAGGGRWHRRGALAVNGDARMPVRAVLGDGGFVAATAEP